MSHQILFKNARLFQPDGELLSGHALLVKGARKCAGMCIGQSSN